MKKRNYYRDLRSTALETSHIFDKLLGHGLKEQVWTNEFERRHLYVIPYPSFVVIEFTHINHLTAAREAAKVAFPDWKDALSSVWGVSHKEVITEWSNSKNRKIKLWFRCSVADYPSSLLKPGCRFIESSTESVAILVCGLGD